MSKNPSPLMSDWFGRISMKGAAVTAPPVFHQLEELLSRLRPAALQVESSSVELWPEGVKAQMVHRNQLMAGIEFGCAPEGGDIMSLVGLEEYYGNYGTDGPLSKVMLEDLARLLSSNYRVDETWWRGRMIRRVVRGPHMSGGGEIESHQGWLIAPTWLMRKRNLSRRSFTVSYNCQSR